MSTGTSPSREESQGPLRRLKLLVNTPPRLDKDQSSPTGVVVKMEGSSSPIRPSYSPVTPTLSHALLSLEDAAQSQWIDQPEPLPVSLDDNPDAIALRATLSILQMQRQQSLRDIRNLDKVKQAALRDPQSFVKDLQDGKLQQQPLDGIVFDHHDEHDEDDTPVVEDGDKFDYSNGADTKDVVHEHKLTPAQKAASPVSESSRFGKLPTPQNVVRCPPIEWSKYHIAGEPLDRLHELQREYPGLTAEALARGMQPHAQVIAAPYRPFTDKVESRTINSEGPVYK